MPSLSNHILTFSKSPFLKLSSSSSVAIKSYFPEASIEKFQGGLEEREGEVAKGFFCRDEDKHQHKL